MLLAKRCSLENQQLGFDFHVLAMLWPGTDCTITACPDRWTIHGLWPSRYDRRYPTICKGKYMESVIKELKNTTKLEYLWLSLNETSSNEAFWKHEWNKHGACSKLGFRDYFNTTLRLAEQFDIGSILESGSVLKNQKNKLSDINNAVGKNTGKKPVVMSKCIEKQKSLYQIEICFDKEYAPIDCEEVIFYPEVNNPMPLAQTDNNGCELSTNGKTRIHMFSPILLMILLWHCDVVLF